MNEPRVPATPNGLQIGERLLIQTTSAMGSAGLSPRRATPSFLRGHRAAPFDLLERTRLVHDVVARHVLVEALNERKRELVG